MICISRFYLNIKIIVEEFLLEGPDIHIEYANSTRSHEKRRFDPDLIKNGERELHTHSHIGYNKCTKNAKCPRL